MLFANLSENKRYQVYLHALPSMTRSLLRFVLDNNLDAKSIFVNPSLLLDYLPKKFTEFKYLKIKNEIRSLNIEKLDQIFYTKSIGILSINDADYPKVFLELKNPKPPPILYYIGDPKLLNNEYILGIVGTRKPSNYGCRVVVDLLSNLSLFTEKLSIVSGGAYGVDILAQKEGYGMGFRQITVLGSGFNQIYPFSHVGWFDQFASNGILISEYTPNFQATNYSFPERNRLVAALAKILFVAEAPQKSGALLTANLAFHDFSRTVFTVPASIYEKSCMGNNYLLYSQVAKPYIAIEHLVADLGLSEYLKTDDILLPQNLVKYLRTEGLELDFTQIYQFLEPGQISLEEIINHFSHIDATKIVALISYLQINNFLARQADGSLNLKSRNSFNFFDSS